MHKSNRGRVTVIYDETSGLDVGTGGSGNKGGSRLTTNTKRQYRKKMSSC